MKKYILFLFLIPLVFSQSLTLESITITDNVEEGDTFDFSITVKNIGNDIAGTGTDPIIATLSSSNNCIVNVAKILGIIQPSESIDVSWVITAPVVGSCDFTISSGTLLNTVVSEIRTVGINAEQETQQSGGESSSGSGGSDTGGLLGGISNNTTTEEIPDTFEELTPESENEAVVEIGPIPEEIDEENTEIPEEQLGEISTPITFYLIIGLVIVLILFIVTQYEHLIKKLKRRPN